MNTDQETCYTCTNCIKETDSSTTGKWRVRLNS